MNPIYIDQAVPLTAHERESVLKRLRQIAVALGHPRRGPKQAAALIRERAALEQKLAAPIHQRRRIVLMKKIRYSDSLRLDGSGIVQLDVHLPDCGTLLPYLRARNLQFDCVELDAKGERVTFDPGTRLDRVHAVVMQFDDLSR